MVHKFQELDNYDDYDPAPYRGGYDINATYGGVKAADEECAYRRAENAGDDQEQEVQYGNERNPYEHGPPGPSIFGGRPKPGAVYGGGRDRTRPHHGKAQPDQGVATGYARPKPAYGADSQSLGKDEGSGYSKPRPSYGYGEEENSSYRKPRPSYGYGEEEDSDNRKPRPTYTEDEVYDYRIPRPAYTEEQEDSGYRKPYGEEESSGYWKPYYYGEEEPGYRMPRPSYGGDYGYGGRRNNDDDDDDTAKFLGGSAYTVVPLPAPEPAKRSWW